MAYTPELSQQESGALRRIAWNLGRPITKTLTAILQEKAKQFPAGEICSTCRDKKRCAGCLFHFEQSDNERRS